MISAQSAIVKMRRGLTLGAVLRWALFAIAAAAVVAGPLADSSWGGPGLLLGVVAIWVVLTVRSLRGSRIAADSPALIATGQFDLAEQHIAQSLETFSLFRGVKLMSLHHLALLRHAQNRWQESALLNRALLGQRPGNLRTLQRTSQLMLAESLLELNDLNGVYDSLALLHEQRLNLGEALNLLSIQLDYSARIGAWASMFEAIEIKVQTLELLPPMQAARGQAWLALAAKKMNANDWADWLRRRVELLIDIQTLCADRPMLKEVWESAE